MIVHLLCADDAIMQLCVVVLQVLTSVLYLPKNSLLLCMCSGSLTYHTTLGWRRTLTSFEKRLVREGSSHFSCLGIDASLIMIES